MLPGCLCVCSLRENIVDRRDSGFSSSERKPKPKPKKSPQLTQSKNYKPNA